MNLLVRTGPLFCSGKCSLIEFWWLLCHTCLGIFIAPHTVWLEPETHRISALVPRAPLCTPGASARVFARSLLLIPMISTSFLRLFAQVPTKPSFLSSIISFVTHSVAFSSQLSPSSRPLFCVVLAKAFRNFFFSGSDD